MDEVVLGTVRAMAADVRVHASGDLAAACDRDRLSSALRTFTAVDRACTRFDAASPLMRANHRPGAWHSVPPLLYRALEAAHRAHEQTHGRFDPRVFGDLVRLGYDRSFRSDGDFERAGRTGHRRQLGAWRPRFRGATSEVNLGGRPVDLGGIGKGLALRWAAESLDVALDSYVLEAGGDCLCRGSRSDGEGWRIGVEDPRGGARPVAVLGLRDRACATSSVRVRTWRVGERSVHHLIDPRTGMPGGHGLLAVTVVSPDPASAEVLSKTLFLHGRSGIGAAAARRRVAALWVATDGDVGETSTMKPYVEWRSE